MQALRSLHTGSQSGRGLPISGPQGARRARVQSGGDDRARECSDGNRQREHAADRNAPGRDGAHPRGGRVFARLGGDGRGGCSRTGSLSAATLIACASLRRRISEKSRIGGKSAGTLALAFSGSSTFFTHQGSIRIARARGSTARALVSTIWASFSGSRRMFVVQAGHVMMLFFLSQPRLCRI